MIEEAEELLPCFLIVVSGEFVTNYGEPQTMIVVLDVPGMDIEQLDGRSRWRLDALFNNTAGRKFGTTQTPLKVSSGIVRAYEPTRRHPSGRTYVLV
jgi:hypothetical protein